MRPDELVTKAELINFQNILLDALHQVVEKVRPPEVLTSVEVKAILKCDDSKLQHLRTKELRKYSKKLQGEWRYVSKAVYALLPGSENYFVKDSAGQYELSDEKIKAIKVA